MEDDVNSSDFNGNFSKKLKSSTGSCIQFHFVSLLQ